MDDFVAYPSKWRIALLALTCAGFVVIGLWMIGLFGPEHLYSRRLSPSERYVMGWVGVIFFGLCGVIIIKKYFDSSEQIRIGPAGVLVRSWSDQTIPWSEITDVRTLSIKWNKAIILYLRDPSLFSRHGLNAKLEKTNRALGYGDVAIVLIGTDGSYDDAIEAIARFRAMSLAVGNGEEQAIPGMSSNLTSDGS